jgi:hypothetical protein
MVTPLGIRFKPFSNNTAGVYIMVQKWYPSLSEKWCFRSFWDMSFFTSITPFLPLFFPILIYFTVQLPIFSFSSPFFVFLLNSIFFLSCFHTFPLLITLADTPQSIFPVYKPLQYCNAKLNFDFQVELGEMYVIRPGLKSP